MVSRKRIFEIAKTEKKKRESDEETLFETPLAPIKLERFAPILETGLYLDYKDIIIPKPFLERINSNPEAYNTLIYSYKHGQHLVPGRNVNNEIKDQNFAGYFNGTWFIIQDKTKLFSNITSTKAIPEKISDELADIIENRPKDFFEGSIYDDLTLWETDNLDLIYGDMANRIIKNGSDNDRSKAEKYGISNALKSTLLSALEIKHSYPPSIAVNIEGTYPSAIPATIHGSIPSKIHVHNEVIDFIKQYLTDSGYLKGEPILSSSESDILLEQEMDGEGEFVDHTESMEEDSFEIKYYWISEGIIGDRLHTLLNDIYKTQNNGKHDLITRHAYITRMNNKWFKISDLFENYILCIDMQNISLYKYSSYQSFDMTRYSEKDWCVPHGHTKVKIPTRIQKEATNSYKSLHMESNLHQESKELYDILIIDDEKEWHPIKDIKEQIKILINKIKHKYNRRKDKIYRDALELKTMLGGEIEWRDRLYKLRGEPIKQKYRREIINLRRNIENEEVKDIIKHILKNFPLIDYKNIKRKLLSIDSETYDPLEAMLNWCENNRPIPYINDFRDRREVDRTYSKKSISLIGSEERIKYMEVKDALTDKYSRMYYENDLNKQLPDEIIDKNDSIYSILEKYRNDPGFRRLARYMGFNDSFDKDIGLDDTAWFVPPESQNKGILDIEYYVDFLDKSGFLKKYEDEDEPSEREILGNMDISDVGNTTRYNTAFKFASINEIKKIISEWDEELIESLKSLIFTNEKISLSSALWTLSDVVQPILDDKNIYLSTEINTNKLYNDPCKPEFSMELETLGQNGEAETRATKITPQLWSMDSLLLEPDEIEWNTFIQNIDYFIKSRSKIDRNDKLHFFDNLFSFANLLSDKYVDRNDDPFEDIDYHKLKKYFNIEGNEITLEPIWDPNEPVNDENKFIRELFEAISHVISEKMDMFADRLLEKNEGNTITQMMIRNMQTIFERPEALRSMTVTYVDQQMVPRDYDKKPVSDFVVKYVTTYKDALHSASEILRTCVPDINYDNFGQFIKDMNKSLKIPMSGIRNKIYNMPVSYRNRWKITSAYDNLYKINQYDDNGYQVARVAMDKIYQDFLNATDMHVLLIDAKYSPLLKHLRSRLTETYIDRFNADIVISTYPVDHMYRATGQIWESNSCERISGAYDKGLIGDISVYNPILYVNDKNNPGWLGRVQLKHGRQFYSSWYDHNKYLYPLETSYNGKQIFKTMYRMRHHEESASETIVPDDRPYPNKDSYGIAQHRKLWDIFNNRYTEKQATFVNENFFNILKELPDPQTYKRHIRKIDNMASNRNSPSTKSPIITLYRYPGYFMSNSSDHHRGWLIAYEGGMITNSRKIKYYEHIYICNNCKLAFDTNRYIQIPALGSGPNDATNLRADYKHKCPICAGDIKRITFNRWVNK